MRKLLAATGLVLALLGCGAATPAQADGSTLGPSGYKTLHLGQSAADAKATGLLVDEQKGACDMYYLRPAEGQPNVGGGVWVAPELGVVMISGTSKSHTVEGIGMGDSLAEVRSAYADLRPLAGSDFVFRAATPGNRDAYYRFAFDADHRVADFSLESADMGACGE